MLSLASDSNVMTIKQFIRGFAESQDLFHAMAKETHYVYNEKKGIHFMKADGFEFICYESDLGVIFNYEVTALVIMIRCGVEEKTTSLYCKKLAGSALCFGERHKGYLSSCLIKEFLLEYLRVEDDNKEVFWRLFKTLLEDIDFKVNSHFERRTDWYEMVLFNGEKFCLEVKECAFIFYFLFNFQLKSSSRCSSFYNHVGAKYDMLICIFTELIVEHGLNVKALDHMGRDLHKVLSVVLSPGRAPDFLQKIKSHEDSPGPKPLLCSCRYHKDKREGALQIS